MIMCKERRLGTLSHTINDSAGICSAPTTRKVLVRSRDSEDDWISMTARQLDQLLVNGSEDNLMIVDLRDSRQYQNGHIIGARSANCTTKLMSKKTVHDWRMKNSDDSSVDRYIVYDQHSDLPAANSPQMALINYLRDDNKQITFLQGGYDEFKKICHSNLIETTISKDKMEGYQNGPTNAFIVKSEDVLNATASRILPFIFIGNERDSSDIDLLTELGITHILNVTSTSPFYFKSHTKFQYHRLPANDNQLQNLRGLYDEAFSFIDDARQNDGRVLVHCWAGVSRSPSIVIAYIMKHSTLNVFESLKFVQAKRSIVGPNINFMGQLERYYLDLNQNLEKRNIDLFTNELRH